MATTSVCREQSEDVAPLLDNTKVQTLPRNTPKSETPKPKPRRIIVEPLIFLYTMATIPLDSVRTQFLYSKVQEHLNISLVNDTTDGLCDINKTDTEYILREKVQSEASQWLMYLSLAQIGPSFFMALLFGIYSDHLGRKMAMILPPIGCLLSILGDMAVITFDLPIYFLFLEVIEYLFGGRYALISVVFAYISDTCQKESKDLRMTVVDVIWLLTSAVANLLLGYLIKSHGFIACFYVLALGQILSLTYAIFFIPEVIPRQRVNDVSKASNNEASNCGETNSGTKYQAGSIDFGQTTSDESKYQIVPSNSKDMPNYEHAADHQRMPSNSSQMTSDDSQSEVVSVKTKSKRLTLDNVKAGALLYLKDNGTGRRWKLNVLLCSFVVDRLIRGHKVVNLYVMNSPLCWNSVLIGYYGATENVVRCIGGLILVVVFRKCLPSDVIACIARLHGVAEYTYMAFVSSSIMMFFSPLIGSMGFTAVPMTRALMSNLVEPYEQGAMFAVMTGVSNIANISSLVAVNKIYQATLFFMPGFIFLCKASVAAISLVFLGIYAWGSRRQSRKISMNI